MSQDLILVTGASGYLATHVVDQLLKAGHKVRGTVRSLKDEKKVKPIRDLALNAKYPLELVEADLLDAASWINAVKDCTIVMHVASPLPIDNPTDEQLVIKPAVEGTLNVLKACLNTKVKRVIVTSSGLAVTGGSYGNDKTFSEKDWGNSEIASWAYCKSKILSEKAAWNFVEEKKKNNENIFELAVINPTLILGPALHDTVGTSVNRFLSVLSGKLVKIPEMYFPTCDVRDVALAHIKAAYIPEAVGHRFLIVSSKDFIPMKKWGEILHEEFSSKGYQIATETEPVPNIQGKNCKVDDTNMREILGITPRDFKSTIIDMANSLIQRGYLANSSQ